METIVLESSSLLDRYYDERTLSSLPNGYDAFFQFGQIDWAYDLIEMIDGKPSCLPIPSDKSVLTNVFHTSDASYSYVNGVIIITAVLPNGKIPVDESHQFSAIGIKDAKGEYVAMAVTQPVWVYSHRGLSIEINIQTAKADVATVNNVGV